MPTITMNYEYSLVPQEALAASQQKLHSVVQRFPEFSINAPLENDDHINLIKAFIDAKKNNYNMAMMIVVGIGGSNLGTLAVYDAIYGKGGASDCPLYFADTVDSDYIHALLQRAGHALSNKRNIMIAVISKSGTTTETIANFECFLALLKKYHPDNFHEFVVAISDEGSLLWNIARDQKFATLTIPQDVGGRYSVFTSVGLLGLYFAGIDIDALVEGARNADMSAAITGAGIIAYHYEHGKNIHDFFVFDGALESLGKWYRQLVGESLGKDGKGITPTVSVGSTDLHSVGQLYLGGPSDKCTTFLQVKQPHYQVNVPHMDEYEALVSNLYGKSLAYIMHAIGDGTKRAYADGKIPFITIELPKKSAFYVGQLLQTKMIEVIMLGHLMGVNPFDQPQVELYKIHTRKILAHE